MGIGEDVREMFCWLKRHKVGHGFLQSIMFSGENRE